MAFGFRYWMVFRPEIDPNSFLLFVHNAAGATKLRNYSSGREQIVGQPDVAAVFRETEIGRTRHECEPHKTDDHVFWYLLVICEVKHSANTCWYAAIESLRQLKLLHLSTAARQLFHLRNPHLALPAEIPIAGLVVAPRPYFTQAGQKSNVLPHTISLLDEFRRKTGINARLATWDAISMAIMPLLDLKASTTPLQVEP